MTRRALAVAFVALATVLLSAGQTFAQPGELLPGRLILAVGGRFTAPAGLGSIDAKEAREAGQTLTLFETESRLQAAKALEVRFGMRISRTLQAEGSASFGTTVLRTEITEDFEDIPNTVATETMNELTLEGAVVWYQERWRRSRAVPFIRIGGGYLGHLDEDRQLMESGTIIESSLGADVLFSQSSASRALGLRLDGGGVVRIGAAGPDRRPRLSPSAGASLFFRF